MDSQINVSEIIKQLNRIEQKLDQILQINPTEKKEPPAKPEEKQFSQKGESVDITNLWYNVFKSGGGELILESGKTYSISTVKRQRINKRLKITSSGTQPANLWVGKENYTLYVNEGEDTILFDLQNGAEVLIENINISQRPQRRDVQQMYLIDWFTSQQNENARWTAILKDIDTTKLGKNGGFGTGVVYGGKIENHLALINYKHAGPSLLQIKNPYKGGIMCLTMKDVFTDYEDNSLWAKRQHLTRGIINESDNTLDLISDTDASCLYNHFFNVDKGANRSTICHIGRFTFMIDTIDAVINPKKIQLRSSPIAGEKVFIKGGRAFFKGKEPHVNDTFVIHGKSYKINEKLKTENAEWTNDFGKGNSPETTFSPQCKTNEELSLEDGFYKIDSYQSSFDLYDKEEPIYLVYKDDFNFRTKADTQFGDDQVISARGATHIAYNHRDITIWADNVHLQGYYRESTKGEGTSTGYSIVNSTGFDDEFSEKEITSNKPMPDRIKSLIT
jgi:hypothetical protein